MRTDRSSSFSFAIRGISWQFRPPIRHSGEGRNDGWAERGLWHRGLFSAWGAGLSWTLLARRADIFILSCGLRKAMVIPAKSRPRTPIRGRNPEGRGKARQPPTFG